MSIFKSKIEKRIDVFIKELETKPKSEQRDKILDTFRYVAQFPQMSDSEFKQHMKQFMERLN